MTGKEYGSISVAVDFALFTIEMDRLKVLLVRRDEEPFKGCLSLPGVALKEQEALTEAAYRCLKEETGLVERVYMEQLYTWGEDCNRDPRNRVISVSYFALVDKNKLHTGEGTRVSEIAFWDVDEILEKEMELAFDHLEIIKYARKTIREETEKNQLAFQLLGEEFTLPELQRIYEILLGKALYKANFRKNVKDLVEDTGKMQKEGAHRPSRLYRLRSKTIGETFGQRQS